LNYQKETLVAYLNYNST